MSAALVGGLTFLGFCLVVASFIIVSVRIYSVKPEFVLKILKYSLITAFWGIFSIAAIAIGARIDSRHKTSYSKIRESISTIWGGHIYQSPPGLTFNTQGEREYENKNTGEIQTQKTIISKGLSFEAQKLDIKILKNIRKKGLLVFPGYILEFKSEFTFKNNTGKPSMIYFNLELPSYAGNITDVNVELEGKPYTGDSNLADGIDWSGVLAKDESRTISISYKAQGTESFNYSIGSQKTEIKDFNVSIETDFEDFVVPSNALVPTNQVSDSSGAKFKWESKNLITGQNIALDFEVEGNYGEVASKLFLYSPLSMFLFVSSLLLITTAKAKHLHPMHYLFIIISFFIFYLLGSYLITYVNVFTGIIISLAVSSGIMLYYVYLLKKGNDLLTSILAAAFIFQWVFSIAFFFPEHTGLLITISTILAFIILLKYTAETEWENKF
ncbi:MAG: hypothetical protein KDK36_02045 [Leptospiraceae bacterium]|nr:hypothetical protein [Leptospiraceae bacterium]